MSPRETGSGDAPRILEVTVRAQPGSREPIRPRTITLTDSVLIVVWRCDDLPPGARLRIMFRKDPRGPFFILESTGNEVVGWGNRGPETARRYVYEATIQTSAGITPAGVGFVSNQATKPIPMGIDPEPREPPAS